MKHTLVYVKWKDAAIATGYRNTDSSALGLSSMETVGILVIKTVDHIQVALTSTESEDVYGEVLSIPLSAIEHAYELTKLVKD
ncbi:hypothetical protein LCGC14_1779410 [marine sediment metagenome]|uniref:Uncharacterized protein n=1 Tax=marine sediment metagenome TaxID=412755 RepID=A0A0F9JVJ7_9ZZZZ